MASSVLAVLCFAGSFMTSGAGALDAACGLNVGLFLAGYATAMPQGGVLLSMSSVGGNHESLAEGSRASGRQQKPETRRHGQLVGSTVGGGVRVCIWAHMYPSLRAIRASIAGKP